ncbi:MAG TPA: M56 family metallopeptidase [Bryobacteraceae bacterium]|nr:M56 family metallopeptidase [Bryobacteraceae bacterium]
MNGLLQHLLESTLFAAVVWLVTLALRRNRARTRHALWMAASVKFLIPFSLFVALGSRIVPQTAAPIPPSQMRFVMVAGTPAATLPAFAGTLPSTSPTRPDWLAPLLWLLWICGCAGILIRWHVRWRQSAADLQNSTPWSQPPGLPPLPMPVRSSPSVREPGVFGIFRSALVLPQGIEQRLSPDQLHAVFAHELCHVRHRDNLAAAIHMLMEALFWFHPLVWWMGARLVEERERACDEEVLHLGNDRAVYAESILRVCEFYLESPVPCVSGITGADLKVRIRNIMTAAGGHQLEPHKKLLLAAFGIAAVAGPVAVGLTHPRNVSAQAIAQTATPLQFDVASVKLAADQNILVTRPTRTPGRFRWTTQLSYLIEYAYDIEPWRILSDTGLGTIYQIEATTGPKTTEDQERLMLQSVLIDRFQLKAHRITKEANGYFLTVAKNGPTMPEAKGKEMPTAPQWDRGPFEDPARFEGTIDAFLPETGVCAVVGRRVTMRQLTNELQRLLDTAVIDQTGLTGKYYFAFRYATEADPDIPYQNLFGAIKELGLELDKHKGPVEMLVIDHIEKIPTES